MTAPSYSAWPPDTDPKRLRRDVARAHEEFLSTGQLPCQARFRPRDVVFDSWQRCRSSGVDPERQAPAVRLSHPDLRTYRAEHPLAHVLPVIRRLLVEPSQGCEQVVAIGDARGRLLWVEGTPGLISRAEGIGFFEGTEWSEKTAGTNAPGTSLALDAPVQIYASEHFSRPVQPWSCSAAPFHDPDTGELLGVVDLTGGDHIAAPHALSLVRATVAAAENELRLLRLRGVVPRPHSRAKQGEAQDVRERSPEAGSSPNGRNGSRSGYQAQIRLDVLGRDRGLLIAQDGSRTELSPRHSEIVFLLARHPRGLTSDALGVRLHEEESARVTVRAEMSRLRRLLGAHLLASRPYRLIKPIATDAGEVHRLLARGAHRRALAEYPAPLLPRSQAPGVVEAREELEYAVRRTLLDRGDRELLVDWIGRPGNEDDIEMLRTALRVLPWGSPHRQLVRARLDRATWG